MKTLFIFILFLVAINSTSIPEQEQQNNQFEQWASQRFNFMKKQPLPYIYGWETIMVEKVLEFLNPFENQNYIVTPSDDKTSFQIFLRQETQLTEVQGLRNSLINSKFIVYEANQNEQNFKLAVFNSKYLTIYLCKNTNCEFQQQITHQQGDISQVIFQKYNGKQYVFFATLEKGVFQMDLENLNYQLLFQAQNIQALSYNPNLKHWQLAFANQQKLWFFNMETKKSVFEWRKSFINNISVLQWRLSDNTLWVAGSQDNAVTVFKFEKNSSFYEMQRAGPKQGLPVGNLYLIDIDQQSGRVYLGGQYGIVSYNSEISEIFPLDFSDFHEYQGISQIASPQSPWRYFYESRWLPHGASNQIRTAFGKLYVANELGMAIIYKYKQTLEQKAEIYQQQVTDRFQNTNMNYTEDNHLNHPGDIESFKNVLSDNEGMWNNLYMASLAYQYSVTKDPKVKKLAWNTFSAQELLYNVIPPEYYGLMAKAVEPKKDKLPDEKWHYCTQPGYEDLMYKDNASSDDVTSYFYAFPIFIDLVCETQEEKDKVLSYMIRTMDYILENNYTMKNIGGQRTHWGFWDPEDLNGNPDYYSERPLNSLEIIGYLGISYKYTKNKKYLDHLEELGEKYQYYQNMLNWKFQDPMDSNFSDDELAYLGIQPIFQSYDVLPKNVQIIFQQMLRRTWSIVQEYQPSWYTYQTQNNIMNIPELQGIVSEDQLKWAKQELMDWEMEFITWNIDNSHRQDIVPMRNRFDKYKDQPQMNDIVRKNERRSSNNWNRSPYQIQVLENGWTEYPATPWLLPYWLHRYNEKLHQQDQQKQKNKNFLER